MHFTGKNEQKSYMVFMENFYNVNCRKLGLYRIQKNWIKNIGKIAGKICVQLFM